MASALPQYYKNTLTPVEINLQSLQNVLDDFQTAISKGTQLLLENATVSNGPGQDGDCPRGSIFSGDLGIALCLLRLFFQNESTATHDRKGADLLAAAKLRIDLQPRSLSLDPGRPSPVCSPALGALVLRAITRQWLPDDPKALCSVAELAIAHSPTMLLREHAMGVDEVLYGRAGLLWAILEIWKRCPDQETHSAFASMFQVIHRLVGVILDAGREGSKAYYKNNNNEAGQNELVDCRLLWTWIDDFYSLGAMHGTAGILAILLDPVLQRHCISISESYADIARTITALCELCIQNGGHMSMSSPPWPSSRTSPLVQICHGAPGLLTLLAAAKCNAEFASGFWESRWEDAVHAASDVTWKQGLLGKGGSLCHGIGGNALALLLLADPADTATDGHLGAALAMLMEAMRTPPSAESQDQAYRMPDHPWSLFEGLAGLLCAWSEACILIRLRLRTLQLQNDGLLERERVMRDEEVMTLAARLLGFPCLVGGTVGESSVPFL